MGKNEYSEILNPILEYNGFFTARQYYMSWKQLQHSRKACLFFNTYHNSSWLWVRIAKILYLSSLWKARKIHGRSQTMDIRRKGKALVCGGKNTLLLIDNFTDSPVSLAENSDMQTAVMECFYNSFVVYKCDFTKQTRAALELLLEGYWLANRISRIAILS